MQEQEQVVNPTEATPVDEAVTNETQETASPETETQKVETPVADAGQKSVSNDLDEFGVPYKNRAMEYKRKLEKLQKEAEERQYAQQAQQPQKYTIEQLEAYALEADEPAHKQWALAEAEKLREKRYEEVAERKWRTLSEEQQKQELRKRTLSEVVAKHPEMVVKDKQGNFMGWNQNSPLVQRVGVYMNNPEIANRPDGLALATQLAKGDLWEMNQPKINQTIEKANADLRNLQKKTLVEGSGNQDIAQVSPYEAAIQKLNVTGSKDDATLAMKEYFKSKGVISE